MHLRTYQYSFVTVLLAGAIFLPGVAYADGVSQDACLSQAPVTKATLQANEFSEELGSTNNQQTESNASQSSTTPASLEATLNHSDQANAAGGGNDALSEGESNKKKLESSEPTNQLADGTFSIESAATEGKVIDAKGGSTANGTKAQSYETNSTDAQVW